MKKVSIIYWSNGGNVESLAKCIAEGIEGDIEVNLKHVNDASEEDVIKDILVIKEIQYLIRNKFWCGYMRIGMCTIEITVCFIFDRRHSFLIINICLFLHYAGI